MKFVILQVIDYFFMIISSIQQLPIREQQRHRTDTLCVIIHTLFVLTLFISALVTFNTTNLNKMTYPTDTSGSLCGCSSDLNVNTNPKHPYLYFTSLEDPTKRLCVNQCPKATDTQLSCKPAEGLSCKKNEDREFQVQIYQTRLEETRMGLFCLPTDNSMKEKILVNSGLSNKYHFLVAYDAIRISPAIAALLGIIYLLIVQYCNQNLPRFITFLGGLTCLAYAVATFALIPDSFKYSLLFKLVIGSLLIIISLALFILMFYFKEELRMCGIFLRQASIFVATKKSLLWLIPVFMVIGMGLIAVFVGQLLGYWSAANMVFEKESVYYQAQGSTAIGVWTVLDFVELLWGLEFLKFAMSFIVSGYVINYYFQSRNRKIRPFHTLFLSHWGSILAGAFLSNFLTYPDLIFDSFMPADQLIPRPVSCCSSLCSRAFSWLKPLFQLCRSESMAYIQLTGLPYCNASRYCEYINRVTDLYNGNQSVNRMYRVGAHLVLVGLTVLASIGYMVGNNEVSVWAVLFIAVSSFFVVTFFISVHADAAEALLITFLTEMLLSHNQIDNVVVGPPMLKELLKREREAAMRAKMVGGFRGQQQQQQGPNYGVMQSQQYPQQPGGQMSPLPYQQSGGPMSPSPYQNSPGPMNASIGPQLRPFL